MFHFPVRLIVLAVFSVTIIDSARITSASDEGDLITNRENKQELSGDDHVGGVVNNSSENSLIDGVTEIIGNIEFPEDDGIIQVYVGNAEDLSGSGEDGDGERDSVDNQTSSKAGQLSGADIKETSETLINQSSNRNETERISDRSVKYVPISPKGKLNLDAGTNLTSENPELVSEVQVEDFMKSRVAYHNAILTDINDTKNMPDTFTLDSEDTKHESLGNLEMLTVEETNANGSSGSPNEDIYVSTLQNRKANLDTTLDNHKSLDNIEDGMPTIKDSDQIKDTENMAAKQVTENYSNYNISESLLTTDTTLEQSTTIVGENTFKSINRYDKNTSNFPVGNTSVTFSSQNTSEELLSKDEIKTEVEKIRLNVSDTVVDDSVNNRPVAERLYAFKTDKEKQTDTFNNKLEDPIDRNHKSITYQPLRDYKDISEEDLIEIQNLLPDQPTFKKEKIEPGVLFEECIDCDFRVLPIRPSQQRDAPKVEEESLPSPTIRFPDLPEGRALQIYSLGLSDGFFLFGYLSEFLSWIQPNEFPVDLLRDALRSQITWISLITQSLQLEAGFVACLVVGVLLALAVPVVVLSHACYRMTSREDDEIDDKIGWAGNCRRRTLVFILQILLVLLLGGMVAMFITNEQLSDAVVKSSDVIQTSLSDVSAFVHNSHLQLHFLVTQSLDQALQSVYADLDNVDSLLGRPIQQELVRETGIDVALESLSDLTREAKQTTQQVDSLMDEVRVVQEMVMSTRDKLSDLKQQVELFRRACGPRDRALCDTIDASGLDVTLRLDRLKSDERLHRMRRMGGVGLEAAVAEAKERFMSVPTKVETDTRDAREAARRQLMRQRADVEDRSLAMERLVRDMTGKVNEAKYQAGFWMQDLDQFEYWRWIICMGGGAVVMMVWTLLLCSLCCGCCGSEKAAGPTILITIVLVCLLSTALWSVALVGMLFGGHGEVFVCRPLYDEPEYHVISRLVDQPGVFYSEPRGGFIANVLYANDTLDVPIRQVLEECKENHGIYPTLGLGRVFDVEAAVDQHRWTPVSNQLRSIRANLSSLQVLSPVLQDQLSDLLATLSVNFTEHRIQMSRPATGKDMDSFSRQLDNVGNQMRDLAVASRMETLSSRTRRLIDSHIRPLEGRKDALVYQLTALEVQTGPLQRQVNQSLSHLKTIQFFINSQGEAIAQRKSRQYVDRLLSYVNQLRSHVVDALSNSVAPCRPLWDIFNTTRLFLCRHTMDPLNGFWFASMWCLIVLLMATPVCLKLVDYYRAQRSMSSGGPSENLMISEQGAAWSSPGYDIKYSKDQCNGNNHYE